MQDRIIKLKARWYRQYGTDLSLEHPSDGIGGWESAYLPLNADKTAFVVMHASGGASPEEEPEQFCRVEYLKRSYDIAHDVFPALLRAARDAGMRVYHVPFGSGYYEHMEGYKSTLSIADGEVPHRDVAVDDEVLLELYRFRAEEINRGPKTTAEQVRSAVKRASEKMNFLPEAMPAAGESIAATENQLAACAVRDSVNHLIYIGFALDGCLLTARGGMMDMLRRRFMCSTVADAVTAIENRESGRDLGHLETGLWRVGSGMGFVYESAELIRALNEIKK